MQFTVKNKNSYTKTISLLVLLTALSLFGCTQLGYLFLPFASAFYAALLLYDKTPKKILSIILPTLFFAVNFLFEGVYSLEAVSYAAVGIIIYFAVTKGMSKGETAFYLTTALTFLIAASAIFLAFKATGRVEAAAVTEFYGTIYNTFKDEFIEMLTSLTTENAEGITVFAYNVHNAEALFRELVILLVPIFILFAFLLSGLSLKFFSLTVRKISGDECDISAWHFGASNFIAYFYIAVFVISMLAAGDSSVFSLVLISLNTVLSCVFAYLGFTFVYGVLRSHGKSPFFSATTVIIVCIIFASFALQLLSFVGVYFNVVTNKLLKGKK